MTASKLTMALLLGILLAGSRVQGGTSPETTLLVVNADSPLSLTVANHWMSLRQLPLNHVVWLHDIPTLETISMAQFRQRILKPVLDFMAEEGITDDIDTIVYSADFPYAVELRKELKQKGLAYSKYIGSAAALTGLTYFANQVRKSEMGYLRVFANDYFRRQTFPPRPLPKTLPGNSKKKQKQVRKALQSGNLARARQLMEQLLEAHPDIAHLRILQAEVLTREGRRQEALQQLEKALQLGFDNSLMLRNSKGLAALKKTAAFQKLVRKMDAPRTRFEPPRGFRSSYHWNRNGLAGSGRRDRYFLSAMLAYTGRRGNSLQEIRRYLSRAAKSDRSHPRGTVYLMENQDIRTETRQPWFGETCALLKGIGHQCKILTRGKNGEDGILPRRRQDIIGLVAGTRRFRWEKSGSRLLPGAIAEALTSYGGDFDNRAQTKLTEFLRHGAAGSSGAVVEPYAFAEKFPLPLMHYYYALGYSLAESWYMAVASPYQTVLVGDPLTQPFADRASVVLKTPDPATPWSGKAILTVDATFPNGTTPDRIELWVDGRPVATTNAGGSLSWDTSKEADGFHELYVVAVEPPPREGRISRRYWIHTNNHGLSATLSTRQEQAGFGTPFLLEGSAPAGSHITIRQGRRKLLEWKSEERNWETILPTSILGMGKITLQAEATTPAGMKILSNPLSLEITPPRLRKAATGPGGLWKKGLDLVLSIRDQSGRLLHRMETVKQLNGNLCKLPEGQKGKVEWISVKGQFRAETDGFYQLSIRTRGKLSVRVGDQLFEESAPEAGFGMVYIPLFLQRGWHSLEIHPSTLGCRNTQIVIVSEKGAPEILGENGTRSPSR